MEEKANGGNSVVESTESSDGSTRKSPKSKSPKIQRTKSSHPPTSEMVNAAIKELKDRKGSSLQAIKKYITITYNIDGEKLAHFIKKYLKAAVASGAVVQTTGKGASGSFKLSVNKNPESKKAQPTAKVSELKQVKKSVEKKTSPVRKAASPKKASSPKKKSAGEGGAKKASAGKKSPVKSAVKPEKAKQAKSPGDSKTISKSKKTTKAPAAKTKAPKPKKASPTKTVRQAGKK